MAWEHLISAKAIVPESPDLIAYTVAYTDGTLKVEQIYQLPDASSLPGLIRDQLASYDAAAVAVLTDGVEVGKPLDLAVAAPAPAARRVTVAEIVAAMPGKQTVYDDNLAFAKERAARAMEADPSAPAQTVDEYALEGLTYHVWNTIRANGDPAARLEVVRDEVAKLAAKGRLDG